MNRTRVSCVDIKDADHRAIGSYQRKIKWSINTLCSEYGRLRSQKQYSNDRERRVLASAVNKSARTKRRSGSVIPLKISDCWIHEHDQD